MTINMLLLLDPSQKNGPKSSGPFSYSILSVCPECPYIAFGIPMNIWGSSGYLFGQLARCLEGAVALQAGSPFTRAYGSSMLSPSGGFLWAVIICIVHGS